MSGLHLPQQQAAQAQQLQFVKAIRLDIARQIYTQLVVEEHRYARAKALHAADPLGVKDDVDSEGVDFQFDLMGPVSIAKQAADAFLVGMGLVAPPEQGNGRGDGGS